MKLYKYYALNGQNLVALINQQFWASKPRSFNDPYDTPVRWMEVQDGITCAGRPDGKGNLVSAGTRNVKQKTRPYSDEEIEQLESLGIICFSSKNDEMLLWSHYADQHKGFVLEFEIDDSVLVFLNGKGLLLEVDYNEPDYIGLSLWEPIAPKYKHHSWEYESEYRYITREGDKLYDWKSLSRGPFKGFSPPTAIIFGERMPSHDRLALSKLMGLINPDAIRLESKLNDKGFGLTISEVTENT